MTSPCRRGKKRPHDGDIDLHDASRTSRPFHPPNLATESESEPEGLPHFFMDFKFRLEEIPSMYLHVLRICQHCIQKELRRIQTVEGGINAKAMFWSQCESTFTSESASCAACLRDEVPCKPIPRGMIADKRHIFENHALVLSIWRLQDVDGLPIDPASRDKSMVAPRNNYNLTGATGFWLSKRTRCDLQDIIYEHITAFATAMKAHNEANDLRIYEPTTTASITQYTNTMDNRALMMLQAQGQQSTNRKGLVEETAGTSELGLEESDPGYATLILSMERFRDKFRNILLRDERKMAYTGEHSSSARTATNPARAAISPRDRWATWVDIITDKRLLLQNYDCIEFRNAVK